MKITSEQWARYSASNAKQRKKSATLREIAQYVREIRADRAARKGGDRLGSISPAQKVALKRRIENHSAEKQQETDVRTTLIAAGRIAKNIGFKVYSSKDRCGNISSYYAERSGRKVRISDHRLPQTAKREAQAEFHGGGAFAGEIIIDRAISATRIRRLLALAEAGRI